MRKYRFKILLFLFIIPAYLGGQNWQLVWSDEFDGTELDTSKWSYQTGTGTEYGLENWGNNELQYYRENNISVSEGMLLVTAKREAFGGKTYTSGRIRTINKGDWKYCKIEFRAKMPLGQGLWAAVWMLPTEEAYGGWAASGELDIMEYLGHENSTVHGTLHFGGSWPNNQYKGLAYQTDSWPFSIEFHDFALIWEEGRIRWYVDGKLYQEQGSGDWYSANGTFPAPFDKEFHLLVNLAVGGNWPGSPDAGTQFPQQIMVDYIRVYQDLPVGTDHLEVPKGTNHGLHQNHPNPFTGTTEISFSLEEGGPVRLDLFDATGRKVETILDDEWQPGTYQLQFDGAHLSPGLYTCRFSAGKHQETRHMIKIGS